MHTNQAVTIALVVAGVMLMDLVIIPPLIKAGWSAVGNQFPPRPIHPDHIRKDFQSFGFGAFNFGSCVHIAVDPDHLHLLPAALLRWAGCKQASIPWDRVQIVRRTKRSIRAKLGTTTIRGPAWCLEFAERQQ